MEPLPIAQTEAARWSDPSQTVLPLEVLGVVALAVGALFLWSKIRGPLRTTGPHASGDLMGELCDAHQLDRSERALLTHLSHARRLRQPANLFVDPTFLEQAAGGGDATARRYEALRQKLFGLDR